MDQTSLVKTDRDIGAKVIEALSKVKIPISLWDWAYIPQLAEWQLIIATPWVDTKGPRTTYRAVIDALQKARIYSEVPMRRLFLKSPNDPQVKSIEREVKEQSEGFIHILKHMLRNRSEYSVIFAPVTRSGAVPMRPFSSEDDLKRFLSSDLGLRSEKIEEALHDVERTGATSIYPVNLSTRQVNKLAL